MHATFRGALVPDGDLKRGEANLQKANWYEAVGGEREREIRKYLWPQYKRAW